ncbi:carboxypeptidase O-like [Rhinoderma darwinii]|uniref:carboxypeptidase O-like n=1 Tax=Rhinoderma darwinii TaxID=43563 RepID=UPI003F6631BA
MKSLPWVICLLGALLHEGFGLKVQYDRDEVLKIVPQTAQHAQYLQEITNEWLLDLWKPVSPEAIHAGREVHMRVPSSYVKQIKDSLLQYNIPYRCGNVGKVRRRLSGKFCRNESWPGEVVMSAGPDGEEKRKKLLESETSSILSIHKNNIVINNFLRQVDLYIVPVFNVDGYVYTWTTDRLWRKNRAPYNNGTCYGVDLNRNFDAKWCTIGASKNCTSNTFCGSSAVSEPETKALSCLIEGIKEDIIFYLTIHSYGKMILLPYGYTVEASKDHEIMMEVATKANAKMKEKHNNEYKAGSSALVIGYFDSGSSGDWATEIGIKFSYTFELRDNGTYGFLLPEDQIQPTCEETTTAIMSMVEYYHENYLENSAVDITSLWLNVFLALSMCVHSTLNH